MTNKKNSKKLPNFSCEKCNFSCSKNQDYQRHLLTRKHKILTNTNEKSQKIPKIEIPEKKYICGCGKEYKHASSLSGHKKNCISLNNNNVDNIYIKNQFQENSAYKEMFLEMVNQNKELMNDNKELHKTIRKIVPNIGNNNNSNNSQVNINVFLNEQCKDAINIMDFVSSLHLQLHDLENTGRLGFVEGTSKIFIDGLNKLELHKRPIHCSDIKDETLYIKDNDIWEKDTANKDKMKRAIDEVSKANLKQIPCWITDNPTYANDDEYMKIVSNIMSMDIENDKSKIIKQVSKEVMLHEQDDTS